MEKEHPERTVPDLVTSVKHPPVAAVRPMLVNNVEKTDKETFVKEPETTETSVKYWNNDDDGDALASGLQSSLTDDENTFELRDEEQANSLPPAENASIFQLVSDMSIGDSSESDDSSSPPDSATETVQPADDDGEPTLQPLELRGYQEELTRKAMEGKNCLIIAPTGTGKTHVALAIAKNHLNPDMFEEDRKVVFFVPTVALVDQQLKQFKRYMDPSCNCLGLKGEEIPKLSVTDMIAQNDVIVMTPQILLNALNRKQIESLSLFSLLIFDECHKMMKDHPYNAIMARFYVDEILKDEDIPMTRRLPQVIGLTASPGVGKAASTEQAALHILQLCANMAATEICTVREKKNYEELMTFTTCPQDDTMQVRGRSVDPFKDKITKVMIEIESKLHAPQIINRLTVVIPNILQLVQPPNERGSDPYTQFLSTLRRQIQIIDDQDIRRLFLSCLDHLKAYHNGLMINSDCRTKDALFFIKKKLTEYEEHRNSPGYDDTDRWLDELFAGIEPDLERISASPQGDNPKLDFLEKTIRKFYAENVNSQGIIFCKTRAMTAALVAWMKETPSLAGLNPHNLIGTNRPTSNQTEAMTHNKLEDVLKYFKSGEHKVIVATTVAEEGLDVKQCNYVIRYEHVTNDIARVQARGRARAGTAQYVLVAEPGRGVIERDEANKLRETMMRRALNYIYSQKEGDLLRTIEELQKKAKVVRDRATEAKKLSEAQKKSQSHEGDFELRCLKCDTFAAWSSDLRTITEVHHVVLDESIDERILLEPHPRPKKFDNWESRAKVLCKHCRHNDWGIKAIYNGVSYCVLQIRSFIVIGPRGEKKYFKKWKDITFTVVPLSLEDMQDMSRRMVIEETDVTA